MTEAQIAALEARIFLICPVRRIEKQIETKRPNKPRVELSCTRCGVKFTRRASDVARAGRGSYCGKVCADISKKGRKK